MSARLHFSLTHLFISFVVASLTLGIIFLVWYPAPLAKAVGVIDLVLMMLVIDVIIGPILSFMIYKPNKKSLKFDLSVIIFLQVCAFCYGVYSIADGRPVWLVYSVDRIELIQNNNIALFSNTKVKSEYRHTSWFNPQYVAVKLSNNKDQREKDMFNAIFGLTLAQQPDRYVSFFQAKDDIQENAYDLKELYKLNKMELVNEILKKYPQADSWVPLKANAVDMVVLMNKEKGEVVKIVDLRPWK